MKKIIILTLLAFSGAVFLSSCASSKGKGCPTTNPNYFKI